LESGHCDVQVEMKRLIISILIVGMLSWSCINIPTPTTPAAASAVVGTGMVIKMLMPIIIAAGIGILIAKQIQEPNRCENPTTQEDIDFCNSLKQAEEMRKLNVH